ncbi:ImmA/IrrE family metallo-endopeptidase [Fructilactobacillus fructivorans]|uniref:ImmA/IrrE family metallo-endopeptidase n=1 Tax=Fructilactobacillus fructivorans TaxID=1614 RepID=A0AAE6P074_9LACO|nr:M12 family metallo-peptidase [Fructilactobacillus fructivorans]KRK58476.1 hypothetical protein FC73_GL000026 [Fructilactobacillus fructivorans]KRN13317.1 hypothetical protein IV37_GL000028 [Fructilactobacillus fructivorans]QFX92484.1 ImmA/IrrE family metallo-endopeptidase [Fructilactobacillus fructivorans]RDV65920.1 ImmA/IrrE family metallo-endopeptidase [Fructilactobacillus fructivorans]
MVQTYELKNDTQSFASIDANAVIVNMNWWNHKQLPFIFAHELGHIMNCDHDDAILSQYSCLNRLYEKQADNYAIDLLIPTYVKDKGSEQTNVDEFMQKFQIPKSLKDLCYEELKIFN